MLSEPEQMDWIRFEDQRAQLIHLEIASVERIGVVQVARLLSETPSALRNQMAGRRKMPPGTFAICWLLDPEFRLACAGLMGEELHRPPDLTPEALVDKQRLLSLTEAEWDMLIDFVAAGLTRCHPAVTRDDLLDLPIGADALLAAADAVSAASHMVRRTKAGQAAGEAAAAS